MFAIVKPIICCLALISYLLSSSASASDEWVVGQVASLSGTNGAELGQGLALGQKIYFDYINANGGIYGKKIRLITLDDKYSDIETVRQTQELLRNDRPIALLGYRGTANTLAVIRSKILQEEGIALIGTLTGAEEVQNGKNIFHTRTPYATEIQTLVTQVVNEGLKKIAIVYADDAFGRAGLAAARVAMDKAHGTLVSAVGYTNASTGYAASIAQASSQLSTLDANAIIMIAVGAPAYEFVKTHRTRNANVPIFSLSVTSSDELVSRVGVKAAQGVGFSQVFPYPYSDNCALTREYRKLLQRFAPESKPSYFSLEGFVNAKLFVEALKRAGPKADRNALIHTLNQLGEVDLGGFFLRYGPGQSNGSRYTDLTVITKSGTLIR